MLLLDHSERAGRKILISGGGRCNFTNLQCTPANFLSENPHFAKSALARYTPQTFVRLVEQHRIPYHHKVLGQLFCDGSAQVIVTMLEAECMEAGVETRLRTSVKRVTRGGDGFRIHTTQDPEGHELRSRTVVVATGGLSIAKMGATGVGHRIAADFGLKLVTPRPALVPLTFAEGDRAVWADLSGLSAEVAASAPSRRPGRSAAPTFREKLLITHRGLSGPAVLQISSYRRPGEALSFDLMPGTDVFTPLLSSTVRTAEMAYSLLRTRLPQRMAERWLQHNLPADWKNPAIVKLESALHRWQITPAGDEGYDKAEVTAGGVSTAGLDSSTLQASEIPGLAFIGEVVDVTGHLGGHNFQWAWASAFAAAQAL